MKDGKFTKIFILAFVAAGVICLSVGLIIFFMASSRNDYAVGIVMTAVGAVDTLFSLLAFVFVLLNNWMKRQSADKDVNNSDKKTD